MTGRTVVRRAVPKHLAGWLPPVLPPRCKIGLLVKKISNSFFPSSISISQRIVPSRVLTTIFKKFHAAGGGSMRIGVIKEEADEQMTLVSMKSQDKKPHVQSIFSPGPPPPSAPVAVPGMEHSRNGEIFSCSAPITGGVLEGSNGESSANDRRYAPDSRLVLRIKEH